MVARKYFSFELELVLPVERRPKEGGAVIIYLIIIEKGKTSIRVSGGIEEERNQEDEAKEWGTCLGWGKS